MKFDPLVTYTEVVRNAVEIVWRGSDKRYYITKVETPDVWTSAVPTFVDAMQHLNFTKDFWQQKETIKYQARVARVNGTHYIVGDEDAPQSFRGFGGSLFLIQFDDGRRVATTNLWCQGEIPPALRDKLPDNAKFVNVNPLTKERITRWLEHMEAV